MALGISPERTVSSLNMAPSSGSNGIKDTDNLEVENEDEKAPQNKKKRKIEMDGSDTDLEEGEVSLHDTDTEPEDNPGEIFLPQGEMKEGEEILVGLQNHRDYYKVYQQKCTLTDY